MQPRLSSAWPRLLASIGALLAPAVAAADDQALTTIVVPVASVSFDDEGPAPALDPWWMTSAGLTPRAILDGPGEVYTALSGRGPQARLMLAVQLPAGTAPTGVLYVPDDGGDLVPRRFSLPSSDGVDDPERRFLEVKADWYRQLLSIDGPGSAWFRHQLRTTQAALGDDGPGGDNGTANRAPFRPAHSIEDSFALFSGGRAVSENLALDRLLPTSVPTEETVAVDSIEGITTRAIDWGPLVDGKYPAIDPLAHFIPADQHALFFPTFDDLLLVADEADRRGTPVVQALEPRAEDAGTRHRYEEQLGLPLSELARVIGPRVIGGVAMTGSDLDLRTGSDVALLFESTSDSLHTLVLGRVLLAGAGSPGLETVSGEILEVPYSGMRTPDRTVSSLVAALGDFVVVTNSKAQLTRIIETWKGFRPSLGGLEEFRYFRDRYQRGEPETAFLILSDATIRRWCGPRWRIGASRRARAAAMLAQLQAADVAREAAGDALSYSELSIQGDFPDLGTLSHRAGSLTHSQTYGTLAFLTPIVELDLDTVTDTEADLYFRWKTGYESNWRELFDPIAVRLVIEPEQSRFDLSVRPLSASSDYARWIEITRDVTLSPDHGDPHPGTLLHLVSALNKDASLIRSNDGINMARVLAPQLDVLSWVGPAVALYADDDPFWEEAQDAPEPDEYFRENFHRLPIGLSVEVESGLGLTAFLASTRAFIEQTAPDMTLWETRRHKGSAYVRIGPSPQALSDFGEVVDDEFAIYYAASGQGFVVSLSEPLIQRAVERQAARRVAANETDTAAETGSAGQAAAGSAAQPTVASSAQAPSGSTTAPPAWLGESIALTLDRRLLDVLELALTDNRLASLSWSNLPILNEWRRLFPDDEPVATHQRLWQRRLVCPGGGSYRWNATDQTMESSVFGHPGRPLEGAVLPEALRDIEAARFGLTFEHHGLRARATLDHARR